MIAAKIMPILVELNEKSGEYKTKRIDVAREALAYSEALIAAEKELK